MRLLIRAEGQAVEKERAEEAARSPFGGAEDGGLRETVPDKAVGTVIEGVQDMEVNMDVLLQELQVMLLYTQFFFCSRACVRESARAKMNVCVCAALLLRVGDAGLQATKIRQSFIGNTTATKFCSSERQHGATLASTPEQRGNVRRR